MPRSCRLGPLLPAIAIGCRVKPYRKRFHSATMPGKTDLSELNCSLARTLEVVGDWWTLLIIRDAFLGVSRFGDFQRSLGIAKNILSTRLERLTESGIMARGGSDARPTYQLTERGRELMPALVALMQWGDRWVSANNPPVAVTDDK